MRLPCIHCGERDLSEFAYGGDADKALPAPAGETVEQAVGRVYLRENAAGIHRELWFHVYGCQSWIVLTRSTVTHEIEGARAP